MNIDETDSINGNDPSRQAMILLTHLTMLFGAFILIALFQVILMEIARFDGISYLISGAFFPLTFLVWFFFACWYVPRGYLNPRANRIQATDNIWSRAQFEDGSTCFIVYQSGFALKYPWERHQGREVEIETEKALPYCQTFIITIVDIALEVKVQGIYRVWLPRLSSFLQNIEDHSATILKQLQAELNQEIEAYASTFDSTDDVRRNQKVILDYVLKKVQNPYREYGINILKLNFEKCDYSIQTQEQLNKIIEMQGYEKIAKKISNTKGFGLVAAAAGNTNIKVSSDTNEVVMEPETAKAISQMGVGGVIAAGLNEEDKH